MNPCVPSRSRGPSPLNFVFLVVISVLSLFLHLDLYDVFPVYKSHTLAFVLPSKSGIRWRRSLYIQLIVCKVTRHVQVLSH